MLVPLRRLVADTLSCELGLSTPHQLCLRTHSSWVSGFKPLRVDVCLHALWSVFVLSIATRTAGLWRCRVGVGVHSWLSLCVVRLGDCWLARWLSDHSTRHRHSDCTHQRRLSSRCQPSAFYLDLLNHVLHHALDQIFDLVDVLDLSLCCHRHVHTRLGSPLLYPFLQRLASYSRDAARSACVMPEFTSLAPACQNAPSGSAFTWERATDFSDTSQVAYSEPFWVDTRVSCDWC